jgi:hypothetical protein
MGRHIREARRHAQKIEYYYNHAGEKGYAQAVYHWDKLADLVFGAMNSKKHKGEAPIIQEIRKRLQPKMDEMEERKGGPNST